MKRYFFIVAFIVTSSSIVLAQSNQTPLPQTSQPLPPQTTHAPAEVVKLPSTTSGFDVKGIANSIMGKLSPLALTAVQNPKVLNTVTNFLTQKSGILGLASSDPAKYASKFAGLNTDLLGKMKGILSAAQYTKFLGLKPKSNDPANALSQLFF